MDAAYVELSKNQLKPFLMRIWGPPIGKDNESIPPPRPESPEILSHDQAQPKGDFPQVDGASPQKSFPTGAGEDAPREGRLEESRMEEMIGNEELSPEINEPKLGSLGSEPQMNKTDAEGKAGLSAFMAC